MLEGVNVDWRRSAEGPEREVERERERKAKLTVDDAFVMPDLSGAVPEGVLAPPVERRIEDAYHDTGDLRLLRWGCTLRHRRGEGWTVTLPVSHIPTLTTGDEIRFPGGADAPPPDAVRLVTSMTRGGRLGLVARLQTDRTISTVTAKAGGTLLEVADDRTRARPIDGAEVTFRQIGVEPGADVNASMLQAAVDLIVAAGARDDPEESIVRKALAPATPRGPDVTPLPLGHNPTARTVVQRALARSAVQLISQLPLTLVGAGSHGVHKSRVATRRMRSDLRTFGPLLDPDSTNDLQAALKPLADRLGAVRDTDVLLEQLNIGHLRHPEIDPAAAARVMDLLAGQRDQARNKLTDHVGQPAFGRSLDLIVEFAVDPPVVEAADGPASERLKPLMADRWRPLERAVAALTDQSGPEELHKVRLRVKRARYASEAMVDVFGPQARRFARLLAHVQDLLGDWNDGVVVGQWLTDNAGDLDPVAAFAAGRMAQLVSGGNSQPPTDWTVAYRQAALKETRDWFA